MKGHLRSVSIIRRAFAIILIAGSVAVQCQNCEEVAKDFKKGADQFKYELDKEAYLVENGFLAKSGEPFGDYFVPGVIAKNLTADFDRTNKVLRGVQKLVSKIKKSKPENVFDKLSELSNCLDKDERCPSSSKFKDTVCDRSAKYRNLNGTCNYLKDPLMGSAFTTFNRLGEAHYSDYVLEIRKGSEGNDLVSPRFVVDKILSKKHQTRVNPDYIPNIGWYIFGQLVAHDVASQTPMKSGSEGKRPVRCCSADYQHVLPKSQSHFNCLPFDIHPNDTHYKKLGYKCHNYIRSQPILSDNCKLSSAQQISLVTHFLDLSLIYGQTPEESRDLRELVGGRLKIHNDNVLPRRNGCEEKNCYYTGDGRACQTPALALWHSLFIRMHNHLANGLQSLNSLWDDDRIFDESRRINIAIFQHITYEEYLPILLRRATFRGSYDASVDARVTSDFSTGVFRYLHAFMPKNFIFFGEDMQPTSSVQVSKTLGNVNILSSQYDDVVRGLLYQEIYLRGHNDEVRNRLFNGLDLVSIDIQRGRDHGLAPYWKYREMCGLQPTIKSFKDLYPLISKKDIELLQSTYTSALDIDLYVAGGLERKDKGDILGPTFSCIAKMQFDRFKQGDRFFYTHQKGAAHPFTSAQFSAIKSYSVGQLLCELTGVQKVPVNTFYTPSERNFFLLCSSLMKFDVGAWSE